MGKDLFVDKAIELFNEKGIKFTLAELATELKISKKTIYKLYGNKEDVINLVIERVFASMQEQEDIIMEDGKFNLIEKIKRVICLYPDAIIDYVHIEDILDIYPNVYEKISQEFDRNWDNTFSLITQAIESELMKSIDYDNLKIILIGLFKELLSLEQSKQIKKMRECVDIVFEGYII